MFKYGIFCLSVLMLISLPAYAGDGGMGQYAFKSAVVNGYVKNSADAPLAGVTVRFMDATGKETIKTATTSSKGFYSFSMITPGTRFLVRTDKTADGKYLMGEDRKTVVADSEKIFVPDIRLSARPGDKAEYVGSDTCIGCHEETHKALTDGFLSSAHRRVLHIGQESIIDPKDGWAIDNDPDGVNTGILSSPPDGSDGAPLTVFACEKNGVKGFAFSSEAKSACAEGVFIPVAATVGGQGDKFIVPGTDKTVKNLGAFKQHFLARLQDVPATSTSNWEMYPYKGSDKDFILLPLYVAQSGNGAPFFKPFRAVRGKNVKNAWVDQGMEYSQACAGCHTVGMKLETAKGEHGIFTSDFDYLEVGVGCENCHGPGSEHAADPGRAKHIINPAKLTASDEREVCARCHGLAVPESASPAAAMAFPWNDAHKNDIGGGTFIAGIYKLVDFMPGWETGKGFHAWDGVHGRHHKQQSYEFKQSVHVNNTTESLTCTACHSAHSLYQGPARTSETDAVGNIYNFTGTKMRNNTVCLRCHAENKGFMSLSKTDVALLNAGFGQATYINGSKIPAFDAAKDSAEINKAQIKVAEAVSAHMEAKAGMGKEAAYTPLDDARPVGRCITCHMPKTGLIGGYNFADRADGARAMIDGDTSSHVGDIIFPQKIQNSYLSALSKNTDDKNKWMLMPNSCSKCHDGSRYYLK